VTDIADVEQLAICFAGPDIFCPWSGCDRSAFYAADLDYSDDVDLCDFAVFQRGFSPAP
jgi:hypothetical protein